MKFEDIIEEWRLKSRFPHAYRRSGDEWKNKKITLASPTDNGVLRICKVDTETGKTTPYTIYADDINATDWKRVK